MGIGDWLSGLFSGGGGSMGGMPTAGGFATNDGSMQNIMPGAGSSGFKFTPDMFSSIAGTLAGVVDEKWKPLGDMAVNIVNSKKRQQDWNNMLGEMGLTPKGTPGPSAVTFKGDGTYNLTGDYKNAATGEAPPMATGKLAPAIPEITDMPARNPLAGGVTNMPVTPETTRGAIQALGGMPNAASAPFPKLGLSNPQRPTWPWEM